MSYRDGMQFNEQYWSPMHPDPEAEYWSLIGPDLMAGFPNLKLEEISPLEIEVKESDGKTSKIKIGSGNHW